MKSGFITETHLLVYCTGCGQPWHCGDPDCPREACCLGTLDDIEIVRRVEAMGWRVETDGVVYCDGCLYDGQVRS
ncbi:MULTISPECIES: hypothetical protein [unclassified Nocardia]|uniref:hypothetical protein n=1 Tax=unclassified Nocardia TaxID=2637762 RepID=UPI001CE4617D|nr:MULTISPECIES: hypothetical protein [unclassified Nocardia]